MKFNFPEKKRKNKKTFFFCWHHRNNFTTEVSRGETWVCDTLNTNIESIIYKQRQPVFFPLSKRKIQKFFHFLLLGSSEHDKETRYFCFSLSRIYGKQRLIEAVTKQIAHWSERNGNRQKRLKIFPLAVVERKRKKKTKQNRKRKNVQSAQQNSSFEGFYFRDLPFFSFRLHRCKRQRSKNRNKKVSR